MEAGSASVLCAWPGRVLCPFDLCPVFQVRTGWRTSSLFFDLVPGRHGVCRTARQPVSDGGSAACRPCHAHIMGGRFSMEYPWIRFRQEWLIIFVQPLCGCVRASIARSFFRRSGHGDHLGLCRDRNLEALQPLRGGCQDLVEEGRFPSGKADCRGIVTRCGCRSGSISYR
jgi:hypothetical protein